MKVIVLTSCTPNEGKTSISFQLALSMAEAGKKTILVDADLRKSIMRGRYKACREQYGLSHCLSGQVEVEDAISATNVENFNVIFAGPVPPKPSELLGSENFREMVKSLWEDYDCVVIDTPPLGSVIDGAVVARECDGAVIVIEANTIGYRFAQGVKEQMEKAGCRIQGCVLNKVNMTNKGYYGKYYEKYYGKYYGSEGSGNAPLEETVVKKEKKKGKGKAILEAEKAALEREESVLEYDVEIEETETWIGAEGKE